MKKISCKYCFSHFTKRFGTYTVGVKRKQYRKQRFLCLSCRKSFTIKQTKSIGQTFRRALVKDSLEGRSSMRVIARRKHLSKTTVSLAVLTVAKEAKGSIWIAKHFKPNWGHVLSVDGKIIRVFNPLAQQFQGSGWEKASLLKKTWLAGVDVITKDLPHYRIIDGETKIDLYDYFKTLKNDIGYDLRVVICDGNLETMEGARMVYGSQLGIQLCVRHFIETLKTIAREEKQE